jgi:hypothetical protein
MTFMLFPFLKWVFFAAAAVLMALSVFVLVLYPSLQALFD